MTKISTPMADLSILNGNLIYILFTHDGEIDEPHGVEILSATVQLADSKPHTVLYDFNKKNILLRNIAKQFAAVRNEHESHIYGRAFLTYTLQNEIEAKHFINYNKPLCETRIFKEKQLAMDWLNEMILKEK
ncbi:MAG TPA: hypothetical protein VGO45_06150 [Bacteroidia bacterium]|jgi:hypothetical protein|nr:hypothetical protein [Bacteroidia bacterium]